MTVKAHAACVLIALVLAASVAGCTGPAAPAPAAATPAPTTLGSSAGPVSAGGGSGTVEDRAARSDQLLATMEPRSTRVLGRRGHRRPRRLGRGPRHGQPGAEDTLDHRHPVRHRLGVQTVHRHRDAAAVLRRRPHPAGPGVQVCARAARLGGPGHPRPADPPHQRHPRLRSSTSPPPGSATTTPTTQQDAVPGDRGHDRTQRRHPAKSSSTRTRTICCWPRSPPPRPAPRYRTCSSRGCSTRSD